MVLRGDSGSRRGRRLRSPPLDLSAAARGDPRRALEEAAAARGVDWRRLSLSIGRNAAYVQQYLRRGTPRRLDERDRAALAAYLEMDEALLRERTGSDAPLSSPRVARLDVAVSAGAGAFTGNERTLADVGLSIGELRKMTRSPLDLLTIVKVTGDSMAPTLLAGDDILVDAGARVPERRDAVYVLRRDDALSVKRLSRSQCAEGRIAVLSDNPDFPDEADVALDTLDIVGRVRWVGRAL